MALKRKDGSTRRWPTSRKTCTGFPRRTSTTASVPSWPVRNDISLSWTTTTQPTCSAATAIAGAPTCSCRWCADRYGPDLVSRLVHSRCAERRTSRRLPARRSRAFIAAGRSSLYQSGIEGEVEVPKPARGTFRVCRPGAAGRSRVTRALAARGSRPSPVDRWTALGTSSHFIIVEVRPPVRSRSRFPAHLRPSFK